MSMLNFGRKEPRVSQNGDQQPQQQYSPAAVQFGEAASKYVSLEQTVEQLKLYIEEYRGKLTVADAENRLLMQKNEKLAEQNDMLKEKLAKIVAKLDAAAKVLVDCYDRADVGTTTAIDMNALAEELAAPIEGNV
jgi:chromosome segregation ATPase